MLRHPLPAALFCALIAPVSVHAALPAGAKTLVPKYEMPVLENPIVYDLEAGPNAVLNAANSMVPEGRDVLVLGSMTGESGEIHLQGRVGAGARNCVILGGHYTQRIAVRGFTGTVYIEGVHVDRGGVIGDALVAHGGVTGQPIFGTGAPVVFIQNSRAEHMDGDPDGIHGDIFQVQGWLGGLVMYNFTGNSAYQGITVHEAVQDKVNPEIGFVFEKVNLAYWNHTAWASCLMFLDADVNRPYPITFTQTYIGYKPGEKDWWQNYAMEPNAADGAGVMSGNAFTWNTDYDIVGPITRAEPTFADFVPAATVGANYFHTIRLQAEACTSYSGVTPTAYVIGSCDAGDWAKYSSVYLGKKAWQWRIRYSAGADPAAGSGDIELRADSLTGPLVASASLQGTGSFTVFTEIAIDIPGDIGGVHDLYVVFKKGAGSGYGVGNFDRFDLITR